VTSAVTSPTGCAPISWASASAASTIVSTSATAGYVAISSAAGVVVRATFSAV
jgi:hypothetical protein